MVELDPGDIIYYKDTNTYWIYLGKDENISYSTDPSNSNIYEAKIVNNKCGLWTSDQISKLAFDTTQMFKVNDDIAFHFKFKDNKSIDDIIDKFKSEEAVYIMTLKDEQLSALNAAYTLYNIKNSNKRS